MKRGYIATILAAVMLATTACTPSMQTQPDGTVVQLSPADRYQTDAKKAVDAMNVAGALITKAISADVIHGNDSDNVIAGFKAAKDGLTTADSMAKTDPSGAASKVAWSMGIFAATQTYLAAKGVK